MSKAKCINGSVSDGRENVGNPFGRRVAEMRGVALSVVGNEDLREVFGKILEVAKTGNVSAARLLLSYTLGKPTVASNPDHVDVDEWDYFKKTAAMTEDLNGVCKSLEPEVVLEMGRVVRPVMSEVMREKVVKTLAGCRSTNGVVREGASAKPQTAGSCPSTNGVGGEGASAKPQAAGSCRSTNGIGGEGASAKPRAFVDGVGNGRQECLPHGPSANGDLDLGDALGGVGLLPSLPGLKRQLKSGRRRRARGRRGR